MARKFSRQLKTWPKRLWKSRVTFLVVGIVIGAAVGAVVLSMITHTTSPQTSLQARSGHSVSPRSQQTLLAALDKSYASAKKLVETDRQKGVLTQTKADMVTKKLDEAYAYRKATITTTGSDAMRELNKKRLEWRTWSRDNGVSVKYLVALR